MIPLSKNDLVKAFRKSALPDKDPDALTGSLPKRTAVFAVHGISPIQRYAFQDQVALALQSYLNACEPANSNVTWEKIVHWPDVASTGTDDVNARPSALRIYRSNDDPQNPAQRTYDVYEGYWSPLSKGKTSITAALRWLFNATFLGTSSTANIPCSPGKLAFDLLYVLFLLTAALIVCAVAFLCGYEALRALTTILSQRLNVSFTDLVQDPLHAIFEFPPLVYVELLIDLAIGYVLVQIVTSLNAARKRESRKHTLSHDADKRGYFASHTISAHKLHLAMFGVLTGALVILAGLAYLVWLYADFAANVWLTLTYIAGLTGFIVFLQAARSIADFAVENVLGDVQIYTTHDANSTFYKVREEIIAAVAIALRGVLNACVNEKAPNPEPYYEAIHILGHSLGSTISMDVLILLRQLIREGSLADQQWKRIRSFTTFGTALEKTRFFFDVRQPSLNAAQDQWANDVYGNFFTNDSKALSGDINERGIYWSNHWYFRDIVSNAIVSYQSDAAVGQFTWGSVVREICENFEIPHERFPFAWVHSDYLADPLFWANAGPILTS